MHLRCAGYPRRKPSDLRQRLTFRPRPSSPCPIAFENDGLDQRAGKYGEICAGTEVAEVRVKGVTL